MRVEKLLGIVWLMVAIILSGCGVNKGIESQQVNGESNKQMTEESQEVFAMDTYMSVTAFGKEAKGAVDDAVAEIQRLDNLLSIGSEKSHVTSVNKNGGGQLQEDMAYLIRRGTQLCEETNGAFDITVYPIMEAWGFTTKNYRVPSKKKLKQLLSFVDGKKVIYEEATGQVSFGKKGMKIDFGGIAKGYTSSRIMEIWKKHGITSGMVNLGGNVQVLGAKKDGSDWRIAIESPDGKSDYIGILETKDNAVITSGGYERYFEQDGVSYHHIIDPASGYPADSGVTSVTIISQDGTLADGLSTALFVMGVEKALEFWKLHCDEFDAIIMSEDNCLYVTDGIAENFTSEFAVKVVEQ